MKLQFLERALAASRDGRPAVLATSLANGSQTFIEATETAGDLTLDGAALAAIRKAVTDDRSTVIETADGPVFIEVFNPRLRCVIVGAVHIAQPLARMASLTGYLVTVVDPRTAFASDARFPDVSLSTDWPDEALEKLRPNRRTAIVTLTHDPKLDDPALITALRSDAFYIGALGSKKTHAARCKRLAATGIGEAELARVHGPVGLDIGAISPAEIAISVMAQMTQVLRAEPPGDREAA
ncbi:MAG TPA: XdhC family protein [Stellaceae bacterium]|jgi:xanthine dehydrogenase accessory factor|nr:XdhC family protein [Stellaceae bacterium]